MSVIDHKGGQDEKTAAVDAELYAAQAALEFGDVNAAMAGYDAALALDSACLPALAGKGAALRAMGRPREALAPLMKAMDLDSRHLGARLELAMTLQGLGRSDEARAIFSMLVREPDAPAPAWVGLARLQLADGREAAAETSLRRASALQPDLAEPRRLLADLLARRMDLSGAADQYYDILAMHPDDHLALTGLGQALIGMGRIDEADDQLERALALAPDHAPAHLARARLNLLEGYLEGAWDDMEWRWQLPGAVRPIPPGESWDGDQELAGSTILLWAERGISETVHLLRYVPMVAARGAKVVLGLPEKLTSLADGLEGVTAIAQSGAPLPRGLSIDYNASLSDLPRLFGTSWAGIPGKAFLRPPANKGLTISAPPTCLIKAGLCWSGPRTGWNVPFTALLELTGRVGAAFFGLQTGSRTKDCDVLGHPALVTDLSPTIGDFGDLAARIDQMDLVITVDSVVAHLACALGKETWVLLPYAPDWRWASKNGVSPWHPQAKLFRQSRPGDWSAPLAAIGEELDRKLGDLRQGRHDAARELRGSAAAQRSFLSSHLRSGDCLIDIAPGGGDHAMDAALHQAGDIVVAAVEPRAADADMLRDTFDISGLSDVIRVTQAAPAGTSAPMVVSGRKRGGRNVFTLPHWVKSERKGKTLADIMADHSDWAGRRLIMRIGDPAQAESAIAALGDLRPAAIVMNHRAGGAEIGMLRGMNYSLHRFPGDLAAGKAVAFDGEDGVVLALAADLTPEPIYGDLADPASPAAMSRASAEARDISAAAAKELAAGKLDQAGRTLARALALDPSLVDANINLANLLHRIGRGDAAAACRRRALAAGASSRVWGDLGAVLRELGRLDAAERAFTRALAEFPDDPKILYEFGRFELDRGRPKEAAGLFERAESLQNGIVPGKIAASAVLKSGNLARGMAEMAKRAKQPPAQNIPLWDGSRLNGKTILVRDEGDAVDAVMLSRYIPMVALQGGLVTVQCTPEAVRLMHGLAGVENVIPNDALAAGMDAAVDLLDVPRLLGTTSRTTPPRAIPYLSLPDDEAPFSFPDNSRLHVGMAWVGERRQDRGIPIEQITSLAAIPGIDLISLQRGERAEELTKAGCRLFVEDMGGQCGDLADLASIIMGLDVVVTCDSIQAHIAGAFGKPVWVMLPLGNDWRWVDEREDSVWYPTMRVFRQSADGTWTKAVQRVTEALSAMAAAKRSRAG